MLSEHIISSHIVLPEDIHDYQRVPLCRKKVWQNTVRCLQNPAFMFNSGINVVFVDEVAVDYGGPSRYLHPGSVSQVWK